MLGIIGVLLGISLLIFMIYRRYGILLTSLVAATLVVLTNQLNLIDSLGSWAEGLSGYVMNNFLLFAFSALFGKLMEDSGAASTFANLIYKGLGKKWAPIGTMIATSFLSFAGISSFIIIYTVYPIFLSIWKESDLPRRLIPAAIFSTTTTYAAGYIPGSAATTNLIPIGYLGTEPYAGLIIGLISGLIYMILTITYFQYEFNKSRKNNEGFVPSERDLDAIQNDKKIEKEWLAIIPMVVLLVLLNFVDIHRYFAILIGCLVTVVLFWNNFDDLKKSASTGITNAIFPAMNAGGVTAFGVVAQNTSAFATMVAGLQSLPFPPIFSYAITGMLVGGMTGSSTGSLGIMMQTIAPQYLAAGVPASVIHRVGGSAALTLSSLPHNGLAVTMLTYTDVSHKEGYKPILVANVLFGILSTGIATILAILLY